MKEEEKSKLEKLEAYYTNRLEECKKHKDDLLKNENALYEKTFIRLLSTWNTRISEVSSLLMALKFDIV